MHTESKWYCRFSAYASKFYDGEHAIISCKRLQEKQTMLKWISP